MTIIEKAIDKLEKQRDDLVAPHLTGAQEIAASSEKLPLQVDMFAILKRQGFDLSVLEQKQIKEEFRHIKRPLLRNASGLGADVVENGNVIMVVSTRTGEGKTFTTTNLAFSIAMEKDKTVLLIDADVEKSALSSIFGIKEERGLVEYLRGETDGLSDVIFNTSLSNFKIIPAGRSDGYSTELFSSENMLGLMNEISRRYDDRIVILDLPPLLATSEAVVLASMAGQIVMVVEAGSQQGDVIEAVGMLAPSQIVGLVLNKSSIESRSYYYGGSVAEA